MLAEEISRSNAAASEAQVRSTRIGGASAAKRQEILKNSAQNLSRAGDFSGACEALIAAGEWLQALALAPGVSLDYWQRLASRYCEYQLGSSNPEPLQVWAPLMQAVGRGEQLAQEYLSRGECGNAAMALLGAGVTGGVRDVVVAKLVQSHLEARQPLRAAQTLLGFSGRGSEALALLRENGESEISIAVSRILKN